VFSLPESVNDLAGRVQAGDRAALEQLLAAVREPIYGLAIRMVGDPDDAADAVQEILIRIARHIRTFRGDSKLSTWVFRIAANQLSTTRRRRAEAGADGGFAQAAAQLEAALAASAGRTSDDQLLVEEVKLFCTHGMLLCLDREHRLAYILGEILALSGDEGAAILEVSAEAFRKRLSRAREAIESFVRARCGLVSAEVPCRCAKLVAPSIDMGLVDPARLRFARHPTRDRAAGLRRQVDGLTSAAAVFRSHPDYAAPPAFAAALRDLLADVAP